MAKVANCYFMCDVDAIGGDPRMTGQKRMILCYGASTGAWNQPNRGEINIRQLEITESHGTVAALSIHEHRFLDYWQGCRCRAARTIGTRLSMQQVNYTERQSKAADHCRPRAGEKQTLGAP